MALLNIVNGVVRGKVGEGFGDPYNNTVYYKINNSKKAIRDEITTKLWRKYGIIAAIPMRAMNDIYNIYIRNNCADLKEMSYWNGIVVGDDIQKLTVQDFSRISRMRGKVYIRSITQKFSGSGFKVYIASAARARKNKTTSLVVMAFDEEGKCIGQTYSAANNAVWDEKRKCFVVPKGVRYRWQKAEGGEFAYTSESEADLELIYPVDKDVYIVAYEIEVGNYKWTFSDGSEAIFSNNKMRLIQ